MVKSSSASSLSLWLRRSIVAQFFGKGAHHDAAVEGLGCYAFHYCRVGRYHHIILIHAPVVVAFRLQHADDAEGDALEADDFAHAVGIFATEEFLHNRGADDADLGALQYVFFREAVAALDVPKLDGHVVGTLAVHRAVGILGAVDDLSAAGHFGADVRDECCLAEDALVVGLFERLHGRRVESDTTSHLAARSDGEQVGAHLAEVFADALLRTLSDGHHDDDGRHADDDAKHAQEGAELVAHDGSHGHFQ